MRNFKFVVLAEIMLCVFGAAAADRYSATLPASTSSEQLFSDVHQSLGVASVSLSFLKEICHHSTVLECSLQEPTEFYRCMALEYIFVPTA
ncbi:hypothetical protein IW261DRAFT_1506545 [Armillaria novae-zelandiae]|uniref:Uncharacterized protein n=1 Tax=Armillaria novae-zelandiae TaxID=153914 RepID=A0AA39NW11_9AGAR|nr:hypothetical protein IW261DRAFT_1506545 [Armillaria novae-zelandiae]